MEACGEIDRANPLETPEIVVARVYGTSVNLQVLNLTILGSSRLLQNAIEQL